MRTAIVVLPGGIKKNGTLPFFVRARLDRAYYIFQQTQAEYIIVTGKWDLAIDEELKTTESEAMKMYLLRLGVPLEKILVENKSRDAISSLYHTKVDYIEPLKIKEVYFVTSHFEKERIEYLVGKLFDKTSHCHFIVVQSALSPKILWEFFTNERKTLLATRAFLSKMKKGNHQFLTHRFYSAPFYEMVHRDNPQKMVYDNRIGKKSSIHNHYSLYTIFKKKKELFAYYHLTESKFHRGSKVDFWSGRFLPFVGRSENKTIHVLKFALLPKDKKTFENEIKVTRTLKSKGISFIPTIIDHNTNKAPIWYLYKAMPGKIAGRFSSKFSFEDGFYREYVLSSIIRHLSKLRTLSHTTVSFPSWNKRKYETHFLTYSKIVEKYDEKLAHSTTFLQAKKYFLSKTDLFDKARLYLSHNDLHPANILISPRSEKVHFIDFEHVALNTIVFDFCFLYVFSWDNGFFQEKLYKAFRASLSKEEKKEFDMLFYPTYCCFLVWLLAFVLTWEGRAEHERYQQARSFILAQLKHIVQVEHKRS